jgi:hypothetical protein
MTAKKTTGRKKSTSATKREKRPRSLFRRLVAGGLWLAVICAILYGSALLLARTAGFRSVLAEQIEQRSGVKVNIARSALDWKLNLWLDGITSDSPANVGEPMIEALGVRLDWGLEKGRLRLMNLRVEGAQVRLVQGEDGEWLPGFLAPLANKVTRLGQLGSVNTIMKEAPARTAETAPAETKKQVESGVKAGAFFENMNVTIEGAVISWWSGGNELASITGLDFVSRNVEFPGRNFQYYQVKAARAELGDHRKVDNLSFEMLSTEGRNIVLGPKADWKKKKHTAAVSSMPVAPAVPFNDDMTALERELLSDAETVLQREPVGEPPLAVPQPKPVPPPVVVETVIVRSDQEPPPVPVEPYVVPDQDQDTLVIEEEFDITAFDELSEDESEALVEYIQEMLEIDPANMGSDYD